MEAIRGCALGRRSARDPGVRQIRVARARGVRSKGGTGTSALQRMGCGAKRRGTLAQRPPRAASRGARGEARDAHNR